MCGITGLISKEYAYDREKLARIARGMTGALKHRGPDSDGLWQHPEIPVVFGHRRLAIVDLSPSGHQPMTSPSARYTITFNGEIYNFRALRAELEQAHQHIFKGQSDTEILLAALEYYGLNGTLSRISGMFAFVLWDAQARALHFARDRWGKKPLYIGWAGDMLIFGSELKALMAHPDFARDINRESLTAYMRFGYVPAPLSIFDKVWHVPPGHMLSLDIALLQPGQDISTLFEPYWLAKQALETARLSLITDETTAKAEFDRLLRACVADRMVADVPLGAFLSGGLDSSLITALMQAQSKEPIKTYTIGFDEPGFNEATHARDIAAHLGTDHHETTLHSDDALALIDRLPEIYDEPFADASALPMCLLSGFARRDVTVALSGDGGDEMLGGYTRHRQAPKIWSLIENTPRHFKIALAAMIRTIPAHRWDALQKHKPQFGAHMYKLAECLDKISEADVYLSLVSTFQKPKTLIHEGREPLIPLVDPTYQPDTLEFAEMMLYWDALSYMNGDILTKVDRATMAYGLEARAPFLDTRIFDFVWRLPLAMKIKNGKGKYLLRETLKTYIPERLFERPKQGFSVPIDSWLRGPLKNWAADLLDPDDLRAQGLLHYPHITALWSDHARGRGGGAQKLWTVLMFQHWRRTWLR